MGSMYFYFFHQLIDVNVHCLLSSADYFFSTCANAFQFLRSVRSRRPLNAGCIRFARCNGIGLVGGNGIFFSSLPRFAKAFCSAPFLDVVHGLTDYSDRRKVERHFSRGLRGVPISPFFEGGNGIKNRREYFFEQSGNVAEYLL